MPCKSEAQRPKTTDKKRHAKKQRDNPTLDARTSKAANDLIRHRKS